MKTKRHDAILDLIRLRPVETQEELLGLLAQAGFAVTQATVSRDIKELNLVKLRDAEGRMRYIPHQMPAGDIENTKYLGIMKNALKSVDFAVNMIVVKCFTGMAQAACASIDALHWNHTIVGTLAGEDTIFIVTKSEKDARLLSADLKEAAG